MFAILPGFLVGLSLIVAIGAQNAFVIRQGLNREHVISVAAICASIDAALISVFAKLSWLLEDISNRVEG